MRVVVLLLLLALAACATPGSPPRVALAVPAAFAGQVERETYRQSVPLADNLELRAMFPNYRAEQPTTKLQGRWTDPSFTSYSASGTYYGRTKHWGWTVEVRRGASAKVQRVLPAKDGYEANLGSSLDASPRVYPRFRHKRFAWGEAVSFLVQYQNDNTNYVPNNGMLLYEVHGIAHDGRYTVRGQFD